MESVWLGDEPPPAVIRPGANKTGARSPLTDSYTLLSVGSHECSRHCLDLHSQFVAKCLALIIMSRISVHQGVEDNYWFNLRSPMPEFLTRAGFDMKQPQHVAFIDPKSGAVVEQWAIASAESDGYVDLEHVFKQAVLLVRSLALHLTTLTRPNVELVYTLSTERPRASLASRLSLPVLVTPHVSLQITCSYEQASSRKPLTAARPASRTGSTNSASTSMRASRLSVISEGTVQQDMSASRPDVSEIGEFYRMCDDEAANNPQSEVPIGASELKGRTDALLRQIEDALALTKQAAAKDVVDSSLIFPLTSSFHLDDDLHGSTTNKQ